MLLILNSKYCRLLYADMIASYNMARTVLSSDVNKDWTPKDKDKDPTLKDKDKDKDQTLKASIRTRIRTRTYLV